MPKFEKQQRVTVPGTDAQGVVVDIIENVTGYPVYALRWLDTAGEPHHGSCGEGDLAQAQYVPPEGAAADLIVGKAFKPLKPPRRKPASITKPRKKR